MALEVVAWVLNLGAELELMDPDREPSPRLVADSRTRARRLLDDIRRSTGTDVVVLDGEHSAGWPPPTRGECWCPTPRALARLRLAGIPRPDAPPFDVLRRVNHRRFTAELGVALPGGGYCESVAACAERIGAAPERRWLLKRPFGFSGRMRKVVVPARIDRDERTWIEASMRQYGGGLQVEPLVERVLDVSLHGRIGRDGEVRRGSPVTLRCDADGRYIGARRAYEDELEPDESVALTQAFDTAARALREAGYFGPFGIDAFAWRADDGERRFHPLSEINARYTMAWWRGMAPVRA